MTNFKLLFLKPDNPKCNNMNLERYQYFNSNDYHDYEFFKRGAKRAY